MSEKAAQQMGKIKKPLTDEEKAALEATRKAEAEAMVADRRAREETQERARQAEKAKKQRAKEADAKLAAALEEFEGMICEGKTTRYDAEQRLERTRLDLIEIDKKVHDLQDRYEQARLTQKKCLEVWEEAKLGPDRAEQTLSAINVQLSAAWEEAQTAWNDVPHAFRKAERDRKLKRVVVQRLGVTEKKED